MDRGWDYCLRTFSQQFYCWLEALAPTELLISCLNRTESKDRDAFGAARGWTQTRQCGQDSWHELFIVNVERNDLTQHPPDLHLGSKGNTDVVVPVLLEPFDKFFFTNGGITELGPAVKLATLLP
jgi:hypothetical protein